MKIESGTIRMDSDRVYTSTTTTSQTTISRQAGTGMTTYSNASFLSSYSEYSRHTGSGRTAGQYDVYMPSQLPHSGTPSELYTNLAGSGVTIYDAKSAFEKFHEELIDQLEQFMERIREQLLGIGHHEADRIIDLTTSSQPGTFWTRQTQQSTTLQEQENTTFNGTGSVVTADGRSIDFHISMEMSHTFIQEAQQLSEETDYILTDPLVIQLDQAPETISEQTWFFDLDGDGRKDEISQLAKGNGFLALDANGNGQIDDGSELFGARTGNGFEELAAYDEDGNGWIDENDSVYSKLKIWVKDAAGNDKLLELQQADIGAIYLGAANTQFSHKTADTNETQAVVRQTGFYLHESTGSAGIVQQIDFAARANSLQ
ncbi:MAG: hypothetical protein IJ801_08790 [Lachnospiraceae bacterium]|nr:hypothetical protein [Lachnospiraceae bacterium]